MKEIWKSIQGFPNYKVSNRGRVKSLSRIYAIVHFRTGAKVAKKTKERIIEGWVKRNGRRAIARMVALRREGKTYEMRVHCLVLTAFKGNKPDGFEGCHNDGNPLNNNLSNLRWDSHLQNMYDSIGHGTKVNPPIHIGSKHPRAIFNEDIIKQIRATPIVRGSSAQLARKFNTSQTNISRIIKNMVWRHVGAA